MRKLITGWVIGMFFSVVLGGSSVFAKTVLEAEPGEQCTYTLDLPGVDKPLTQPGTVTVKIEPDELIITFQGASPNTLYTCWVDHRNRATGNLAPDYPLTQSNNGFALDRGVAPCFATTAPVFEGMGLDKNAIITDDEGNATLEVELDYNPLQPGASPVVAADLTEVGANRVGGSWLREYTTDPNTGASTQLIDLNTGLPEIARSTAQGLTIQHHSVNPGNPDFTSHGHTPGVGGVDHANAFKGDFPAACKP